jgi:hypothetical protein
MSFVEALPFCGGITLLWRHYPFVEALSFCGGITLLMHFWQ